MISRAPFELIFVNASKRPRTACIYLTSEHTAVRSLAWLVEGAAPTTEVAFSWHADYAFIWARTGLLSPGTVFTPVQTWPVGRCHRNQVTLTSFRGAHRFAAHTQASDRESLVIVSDATVAAGEVAVGIAVGDAPALAVQAHPRTTVTLAPPTLACRIATGDFVAGEVLDADALQKSAALPFTSRTRSLEATLGPDLRWTVAEGLIGVARSSMR